MLAAFSCGGAHTKIRWEVVSINFARHVGQRGKYFLYALKMPAAEAEVEKVMDDNSKEVQQEVTDKYSLRGRVFHHLREDILSGKYEKDEELREITIASELGVSRTPVREALRQLELEGLVRIIPNKGAYVTGISVKDIHDIYHIRSYLEGLCARWACEHITKEQLEQLEEIVYLCEFHAKKKHLEQIVELDNRFHEIIYEACDSKMLEHVLRDFHHYVERVRRVSLSGEERVGKSNQEHAAILEALREGDGALAEKLAHEHMIQAIENLKKCGL